MNFSLMELPFEHNALEPFMSSETIEYHYGKHHQTYVNNLNNLTSGAVYEGKSLEEIIKSSDGGVFNNAAQVFNHDFFWKSLTPNSTEIPSDLEKALVGYFGSVEKFKEQFSTKAATHFGSGWVWLVKDENQNLSIVATSNANTPITDGLTPLLTIDVWEHAYYVDTRNARAKYIENYWNIVNWEFAASNL